VELFRYDETSFIAFEHSTVSLHEVADSRARLTTGELASIVVQIIAGLVFLMDKGLVHGSLDSSCILIDSKGVIKICKQNRNFPLHSLYILVSYIAAAGCEDCSYYSPSKEQNPDVKALRKVVADLMGGEISNNDIVSFDKVNQWEPVAMQFLADLKSARSAQEIQTIQ
jgi:hypothetical protein